jgi:hypothetical protein
MMAGRGKQSTQKKPVPLSLSATYLIWPHSRSNPGHSNGKPAIKHLGYGMACLNK